LESRLPPVRAVLFDLDGLLADTETLQKQAFEEVSQRYSSQRVTIYEEMHASFVGKSDLENAREVIDAFGLNVDARTLIEERADVYVDILNRSAVEPMPGIAGLLKGCRERGLRMAVGSSSIRRFVETSLAQVFRSMWWEDAPGEWFDAIVCGDDPTIAARKPAPDIYLECARLLGVRPVECLVLEDSASGIASARRAGIERAIAVPNEYTRSHNLSDAYAVLQSADEVLSRGWLDA